MIYTDEGVIKKAIKTSNGASKLQLPTARGDKWFVWWAQHDSHIYKDDPKINGSGCASGATLACVRTFSSHFGAITPYEFRRKHQQKLLGHMKMPWTCQECQKVIETAGLRTKYYHNTKAAETYKLIKEHLSNGMPAVCWVWYKDVNGNVDKRYTRYAHVILLAGITKDDKAVILDSGSFGPLRVLPLKDVCNHILPGNWLNGFILVYPDILYRVRRSWADGKSQIGAYANLDNAKAKVEEMHALGETYTVYDNAGQAVWPLYRVRSNPHKWETQIGAFVWFKNAVAECELHPGYHVVNMWDEILMTATDHPKVPVMVKIEKGTPILNDKKSAISKVENDGLYTITEIEKVDDTYFGRLKSGAGWVCMDDVRANL